MDGPPVYKKDWVFTQASFDRLLLRLDPDRDRAGELYLEIREKLTKFFQWRGLAAPEEFADRTIDRAARRIDEGEEIRTQKIYLFFHGIAANVLRAHWKEAQKFQAKPLEELPEALHATDQNETRQDKERKLGCLDDCVRRLPAPQLDLVTKYHQSQGASKIAQRNELAKDLGIPLNALRIRAFRIRGELETCISKCTAAGAA